jgi:hypothetical protein
MPFQISIHPSRRWVTIVGTGTTDAASFRAVLLEVVADPSFQAGYRILVDGRALDYTPTKSETEQFANFHSTTEGLRKSKVAVVVAKTVDYGMANMFAILCGLNDAKVRSFRSVAPAEKWLESG